MSETKMHVQPCGGFVLSTKLSDGRVYRVCGPHARMVGAQFTLAMRFFEESRGDPEETFPDGVDW